MLQTLMFISRSNLSVEKPQPANFHGLLQTEGKQDWPISDVQQ